MTTNNDSCRSSETPCFDYRTADNRIYCAPAGLCSLLEPCDGVTGQCGSNSSVCVVNSCCSRQAVCLPLTWTSLCSSSSTTKGYAAHIVWWQTCTWYVNVSGWGYPERFSVYTGTNNAAGCGVIKDRVLLYFDAINQIPLSVTCIRSAILKLFGVIYNASDPQNWLGFDTRNPNDLWIERVISSWNISTATWNNQPNTTAVNAATIPGTNSWVEYNPTISVTDLVKDMRALGQSNYGFMLRLKTETPYRSMAFYSFGHPLPRLRPQLVLIY